MSDIQDKIFSLFVLISIMSSIGYFYYTSDTQIIICKNNDNTIFLGYDWQFKQLNNIINFDNDKVKCETKNLKNYEAFKIIKSYSQTIK
jgi:hypothetical protein